MLRERISPGDEVAMRYMIKGEFKGELPIGSFRTGLNQFVSTYAKKGRLLV